MAHNTIFIWGKLTAQNLDYLLGLCFVLFLLMLLLIKLLLFQVFISSLVLIGLKHY